MGQESGHSLVVSSVLGPLSTAIKVLAKVLVLSQGSTGERFISKFTSVDVDRVVSLEGCWTEASVSYWMLGKGCI